MNQNFDLLSVMSEKITDILTHGWQIFIFSVVEINFHRVMKSNLFYRKSRNSTCQNIKVHAVLQVTLNHHPDPR